MRHTLKRVAVAVLLAGVMSTPVFGDGCCWTNPTIEEAAGTGWRLWYIAETFAMCLVTGDDIGSGWVYSINCYAVALTCDQLQRDGYTVE